MENEGNVRAVYPSLVPPWDKFSRRGYKGMLTVLDEHAGYLRPPLTVPHENSQLYINRNKNTTNTILLGY